MKKIKIYKPRPNGWTKLYSADMTTSAKPVFEITSKYFAYTSLMRCFTTKAEADLAKPKLK